MALGDYILCCKCEGKLIYDGDRGSREWWEERFGSEPQIMCPDCEKTKRHWVGLTEQEVKTICVENGWDSSWQSMRFFQAIEAKLRELNAPQIDPNQWAFDNGLEST